MFLQVSVILFTGGWVPGPGVGALSRGGCLVRGGAWSRGGMPGPEGGAWRRPLPGRPLLRAVRILLECILVLNIEFNLYNIQSN